MSERPVAMQAGPDAEKEQARRVSKWYAETHGLLDSYRIPRMGGTEIGYEKTKSHELSLPERTQLLHVELERWRKRAFRGEKGLADRTTQPDSAETDTPTPNQQADQGGSDG